MPTDIEIYCNCIERVRHHATIADAVLGGKIHTGHHDLNVELIFRICVRLWKRSPSLRSPPTARNTPQPAPGSLPNGT